MEITRGEMETSAAEKQPVLDAIAAANAKFAKPDFSVRLSTLRSSLAVPAAETAALESARPTSQTVHTWGKTERVLVAEGGVISLASHDGKLTQAACDQIAAEVKRDFEPFGGAMWCEVKLHQSGLRVEMAFKNDDIGEKVVKDLDWSYPAAFPKTDPPYRVRFLHDPNYRGWDDKEKLTHDDDDAPEEGIVISDLEFSDC